MCTAKKGEKTWRDEFDVFFLFVSLPVLRYSVLRKLYVLLYTYFINMYVYIPYNTLNAFSRLFIFTRRDPCLQFFPLISYYFSGETRA